ncbi:MAG: hypothetical protein ABIG44_17375 [Planctomycetota bacterium]
MTEARGAPASTTARPLAPEQPAAAAGPLSAAHLRELELARGRSKKIRRAINVALFNAWSLAIFAALSLLIGLFSLTSLVIGVALAVVAYNEFAGARLLRRYDERGTYRLGWNQLGLCGVLVIYASWCIYTSFTSPSSLDEALGASAQALQMVGSIKSLERVITLAVYGGLIVGSILFQGGTAWYYFSRKRHIRAYKQETPKWIIELQQHSASR